MDCLITCLDTIEPSSYSCLKIKGGPADKDINRIYNMVNSKGSINVQKVQGEEKEEGGGIAPSPSEPNPEQLNTL